MSKPTEDVEVQDTIRNKLLDISPVESIEEVI